MRRCIKRETYHRELPIEAGNNGAYIPVQSKNALNHWNHDNIT